MNPSERPGGTVRSLAQFSENIESACSRYVKAAAEFKGDMDVFTASGNLLPAAPGFGSHDHDELPRGRACF